MPKFIVELWLDGYEDDQELVKACKEFIYDQLDFSGSEVTITPINAWECPSCSYELTDTQMGEFPKNGVCPKCNTSLSRFIPQ